MVRPRSGWIPCGAGRHTQALLDQPDLGYLSEGSTAVGAYAGSGSGIGAGDWAGGLQGLFSERSLDRAAVHTEKAVSANLLGVGKLPALEADQPVKLVGDFRQSHINVA